MRFNVSVGLRQVDASAAQRWLARFLVWFFAPAWPGVRLRTLTDSGNLGNFGAQPGHARACPLTAGSAA
jgi:hypothetical protein